MDVQAWRKRNSGEPGNPGQFGHQLRTEPEIRLAAPRTMSEWSRRAIIDVVGSVLAPQRDALTIVGAHAVILRTQDLNIFVSPTGDGDLGVTPSLVLGEPPLDVLMSAAGFEPRTDSRPGLWGRGRIEADNGKVTWNEQIDLITGEGLSGNTRAGKRSVSALSAHGRGVGSTPGIELTAFDRSEMLVADFVDPAVTVEVNVAGYAALICAKSFKLGERLDAGGQRLRDKDAGDLWRLLRCADRDNVVDVFGEYADHDAIGSSVRRGRTHVSHVLRNVDVRRMAKATFEVDVIGSEIDSTFDSWLEAFPQ
jgi:hypothetical protein